MADEALFFELDASLSPNLFLIYGIGRCFVVANELYILNSKESAILLILLIDCVDGGSSCFCELFLPEYAELCRICWALVLILVGGNIGRP